MNWKHVATWCIIFQSQLDVKVLESMPLVRLFLRSPNFFSVLVLAPSSSSLMKHVYLMLKTYQQIPSSLNEMKIKKKKKEEEEEDAEEKEKKKTHSFCYLKNTGYRYFGTYSWIEWFSWLTYSLRSLFESEKIITYSNIHIYFILTWTTQLRWYMPWLTRHVMVWWSMLVQKALTLAKWNFTFNVMIICCGHFKLLHVVGKKNLVSYG